MWHLHMARECLGPVWWWQALIWGVWRPPKSLGAIVALIFACGVMVDWDWAVVSVLAFRGWWWWWGVGVGVMLKDHVIPVNLRVGKQSNHF